MTTTPEGGKFFRRFLEILLPLISLSLLSSPIWASFIAPVAVAYFIIFFDIYFFYKAALLGINSIRGYLKIRSVTKIDWFSALNKESLPWQKIHHVILIPTYREPVEILTRTLTFLSEQEFPAKQLSICLATEDREAAVGEKAQSLKKIFGEKFENFWITTHSLQTNEVAGKSSNLAFAAKAVKKEIESLKFDKDFVTVTSCDADVSMHPKYFALLAYQFLKNDNPYTKFWQAAILFYNNIWRVPIFVRVVHTIYSINGIAQLFQPNSNFNYSTYSLSWNLLEKSGFWDVDVVPEDWHLFFKAFFATEGQVELESIFLPLYADAVEGQTYWQSLTAQYFQNRRWAWGITDISFAISEFFRNKKKVPVSNFIVRFVRAAEQHIFWPVNWWILTFGAALPPFLNSDFRHTSLGFYLPQISSIILTFCAFFFIFVIAVDFLMKPPRPASFKKTFLPFTVLQYILLPITGFFFSSLPGMDAHTRLLFGKRLEYKVTEKIVK
jgi:hypothetical protein